MLIRRKNVLTSFILCLVTCGIYGIVWFIQLTDDMGNTVNDERLSGVKCFLLTLVTCGIYSVYWAYLMGKACVKLQEMQNKTVEDKSILFLILQLFGLGIVVYCISQSELNYYADCNAGALMDQVVSSQFNSAPVNNEVANNQVGASVNSQVNSTMVNNQVNTVQGNVSNVQEQAQVNTQVNNNVPVSNQETLTDLFNNQNNN